MSRLFFAAYPSNPVELGQTFTALEENQSSNILIKTWEKAFGAGRFIDSNILPEIKKSDGLIFELSSHNQNVFFEAGFAIGNKKPVIPVCNNSIINAGSYLKKLGLFDNIGYQVYENSADLKASLDRINPPKPLFEENKPLNKKQPVYVLEAYRRSEFAAKVVSAVKDSIKFFRTFDPQEEYRMALRDVYEAVSESTGIIVTLLNTSKEDHELHNVRASFLAGLAIGMHKECLILTDGPMETPLDFRDFCRTVKHPDDIAGYINDFGVRALSALQMQDATGISSKKTTLESISIGSAAAENEYRYLEEYFVNTAEYQSALNGQGRLVVGRKGSGKTAIFWQVRDTIRAKGKTNLVIDLKPDGYQLRKFKEQLVKFLSEGTQEHTLTAFWEYLIYAELIYKIFADDYERYGRDPNITEGLDKLTEYKNKIQEGREGDFSERMMGLLNQISDRFREKHKDSSKKVFLTTEDVTDLIYKVDIRKIQNATLEYLSLKERTLILIDNVDKGWGAHGVDSDDLLIVRTLMDALRKIERQASRKKIGFDWLLFLRNDVYELLVDSQNDRGKEDKIIVDWESRHALRDVIERRVEASVQGSGRKAGVNWKDIAVSIIDGKESLDWLVERSLMRPRYLIQLVHQCIGHAVSGRHKKIEEEDLKEGYRLYSLDIIAHTNFELRDVFPAADDAIYTLIGMTRCTTIADIENTLYENSYDIDEIPEIIRLMFWFGVLGAKTERAEEKYIYDYRYDEKIFSRIRQTQLKGREPVFINLAFARGLDTRDLI